jgi:hypothetical protein
MLTRPRPTVTAVLLSHLLRTDLVSTGTDRADATFDRTF